MIRIRISYSKTEAIRYTSNLDIHKVWERSIRRASMPLAYSQGFHPKPRLNQACPLPLGFTSRAEKIDIWLKEELSLEEIKTSLEKALHPGLIIKHIELIELNAPSLQTLVISSVYQATLLNPIPADLLRDKINELLSSESIPRRRRGKNYDLRPLIEQIQIIPSENDVLQSLYIRLTTRPGATGRPDEVLAAIGFDSHATRIERIGLLLK